jgi:peptidoglycan/LPS O-acetylase OafA/YrhL
MAYMQGHASGPANALMGELADAFPGHLCVQYFFALSGFVMVSVHHGDFGKIGAIPRFWWLRICRIYPVYWLALCIPLYFLFGTLDFASAAPLVLLDPWHGTEFIPAAWTLRYEFAFYIMFGLFMLPYVGKPLLAYWAILLFWRWNTIPLLAIHTPLLLGPNGLAVAYAYKFVDIYNINFLGGMAAGYLYVKFRFGRWHYAALALAGALVLGYLLPQEDWGERYGGSSEFALAMSCALGTIMLGLAGLERLGILRLGRWAGRLGMVSYPLYIFHMPIMLLTNNILHWGIYAGPALYLHLAALILGTLVLAVLITFLFDQPVQRRLRRFTRRIWPEPAPAAAAPLLYSANPGH